MHEDDYHSFLIRMWRRGHGMPDWLLTVENPHNGERLHFDGLRAFIAFLEGFIPPDLDEDGLPTARE